MVDPQDDDQRSLIVDGAMVDPQDDDQRSLIVDGAMVDPQDDDQRSLIVDVPGRSRHLDRPPWIRVLPHDA